MRGFIFPPYESLAEKNDREVRELVKKITREKAGFTEDSNDLRWYHDESDPEYCGVYWIITTCLTGIAIGIWLGMVLWLISGEHR